MKIRIDQEFAALIPAVAEDADGDLEREVLADGQILNPFVVWDHQNILLDGHRRYKLTLKHPTLKMPAPIVMHFESRQEAHDWIIRHQLSKRNVTEAQRRYLIGKLYRDNKPAQGRPEIKPEQASGLIQTAAEIAAKEGISERTVRKAADFAEAVDAVAPEIKKAVLSGDVKATTADLEEVAALPKAKAKRVAKAVKEGKAKTVKAAIKEVVAESEPEETADPSSLEAVQADLKEYEKKLRDVARFGRKILGAEGNEITRPWCSRYSLLTLIHPIQHVARTVLNDLPVDGTAEDPKLHREQVAESA